MCTNVGKHKEFGGVLMSSEVFQKGNDALWRAKQAAARAGMGVSTWWLLVKELRLSPFVGGVGSRLGVRLMFWRS